MIVKTVFIVKKEQLPIEENVNIVRWIVKIYNVNHHNTEKKTNKTTDSTLSYRHDGDRRKTHGKKILYNQRRNRTHRTEY